MNETVQYEVADGVATITLNRPERMNTMTAELLDGALEAIEMAATDEDARVVVFTGTGRGFCAGADLNARDTLGTGGIDTKIGVLQNYQRTALLLREMPKVTIAAINGACAGAGFAWACATDLRYAAASAKFATAYINVGLTGDFGGTWTLPRIVGPAKAREMYLLNPRFTAAEAEEFGFVSKTLPDDELMPHVREIAQRLVNSAPIALRRIKENLNDAEDVNFLEALKRESERHVRSGGTADAAEAGRAFLEKRQPVFKGR